MELFVVGYAVRNPARLWGFLNVASDVLYDALGGQNRFRSVFPQIELVQRQYRDAGQYQISLHAHDEPALKQLMENQAVRQAAAALALRVMRKRATIYSKFHCQQLAELILCGEQGPA